MFTRFEDSDRSWIWELFPRISGAAIYSDAWLYVTQACRSTDGGQGFYLKTNDFFVGLGVHDGHWVLVRPAGTPPPDFVRDLLDFAKFSAETSRIYVKKADDSFLTALASQAGECGLSIVDAAKLRWDEDASHDDDTYEEHIIDTAEGRLLASKTGTNASRLRSKLRQFERHAERLSIHGLDHSNYDAVVRMLTEHFENDQQNVAAYMNMLRTIVIAENDEQFGNFVPYVGGDPVGIFIYEKVDAVSVGLYASIVRHEFVGLSETMMLRLFNELADKGIRFLNLGGSETEGLDVYKKKFRPVRRQRNQLVVLVAGHEQERFVYSDAS